MPSPNYSLVIGQGRSGTNWLLDLFHTSPETYCRREPYSVPNSPFASLTPHKVVINPNREELEAKWDDVVASTLKNMGPRDPYLLQSKEYLGIFGNLIGGRLISKALLRRALGVFSPDLRNHEWAFPKWLGDLDSLSRAPSVIKLLQGPGWSTFVLTHRPEVPVFQIVRHPGGFLNSWSNRYLQAHDSDAVLLANRKRLQGIAAVDETWGARFGDPETLGIEEAELWYWRYANEASFDLANGRSNCRVFAYEELALDPLPIMEDLFKIAGLKWTDLVVKRILASSTQSANIAAQWKKRLQPNQIELVERIMDTSTMKHLWDSLIEA